MSNGSDPVTTGSTSVNEAELLSLDAVHGCLCSHDRRHPLWSDTHYPDDVEGTPVPRVNCFCDNCFYGRDRLAVEILHLRGSVERKSNEEILFNEANHLANEILTIRDRLKPIENGMIERGHCLAGDAAAYGGEPGKRKTTLKDAKGIVHHAIVKIDQIVNRFNDKT